MTLYTPRLMRLLLISSSTVHGYGYLDHPEEEIRRTLSGVRRVGFVPYAIHDVAPHMKMVTERLGTMGFATTQVKTARDVEEVEAIFIGGGNSFRLLKALYERELVEPIRRRVRHEGIPYVGSSAGTNVATPSIKTTNDMPIVYPPAFEALGLFPYQVNPHYLDADPQSTHKGETREQRLLEYLEENDTPVIGLREGSMLRYEQGVTTLVGEHPARIFTKGREPYEVDRGAIAL
jgi:dipeptidase E